MSSLPSRDIATQIVKAFDVRGLAADRAGQAMQIVEAFASGRLVDRESIAWQTLLAAGLSVAMPSTMEEALEAIAAAIGGPE